MEEVNTLLSSRNKINCSDNFLGSQQSYHVLFDLTHPNYVAKHLHLKLETTPPPKSFVYVCELSSLKSMHCIEQINIPAAKNKQKSMTFRQCIHIYTEAHPFFSPSIKVISCEDKLSKTKIKTNVTHSSYASLSCGRLAIIYYTVITVLVYQHSAA